MSAGRRRCVIMAVIFYVAL